MTTKLRWICLGWLSLAACGDTGGPEPSTFLLPSVDPMADGVPGANVAVDFDTNAACIIRYDFAGDDVDIECRTERVNGDPSHWIRTCPEHSHDSPFWLLEEFQLDESGRTVFERHISINPSANYSAETTYDELGRLVRRVSSGVVSGDRIFTVDAFDDAGRPLHATDKGPDWVYPYEGTLPGTGNQFANYAYDAHGRLTFREFRFVSNGAAWWSETIAYDDAARRRNGQVILDTSSVDPGSPLPGVNGGYDLFDAEGRLVEQYWSRSSDPRVRDDWTSTYRYDEQGRLLTETFDFESYGSRTQYVSHHIYDCQ